MKKLFLILLATAGISFTSAQSQTITGTVGTGADTSYFVIEATDFGAPLTFAYLYDYNPANPLDTYAMMVAIDAAIDDLQFTYINYGTVSEPNYFLDSVTYQTITLTNTPAPTYSPYWAQWVSGGLSGYPEAEPILSGSWTYGSGVSAPVRYIEPGSWDGFIYNDGMSAPSVSPVPEPSSTLLTICATGLVAFRRRVVRAVSR